MDKELSFFKGLRGLFVLSLIVFIILALVLYPRYKYEIQSDGISYISISMKYLRGDISHAINGYWGPLTSWLMIPFFHIGLSGVLSFHVLSLLLGIVALCGIRLLFERFDISVLLKKIMMLVFIPVALYFSLRYVPADLLLTCLLLFYLYKIFDPNYAEHARNAFLIALLGVFAFLSKAYAFPFFIVHFTLVNIIVFWSKQEARKKVLLNFFVGIFTFITLSAPWIFLISKKYEKFTVGTTGEFNYKLHNPSRNFDWSDFQIPPNETALSGWEDPSYYDMGKWWFSPGAIFKLIYSNILSTVSTLQSFSAFSAAILLSYLIYLFLKQEGGIKKKFDILLPLMSVLIYCGGYSLVHIDARFLWIVYVMLILMGFFVLDKIMKIPRLTKSGKFVLTFLFAGSFLVLPRWELDPDRLNKSDNKYLYNLSERLSACDIKGKVASNGEWNSTLTLVYFMSQKNTLKYFGVPRDERELTINEIDYFFLWKDRQADSRYEGVKYAALFPALRYEDAKLAIYGRWQNKRVSDQRETYKFDLPAGS
jgi:hypothetical protein